MVSAAVAALGFVLSWYYRDEKKEGVKDPIAVYIRRRWDSYLSHGWDCDDFCIWYRRGHGPFRWYKANRTWALRRKVHFRPQVRSPLSGTVPGSSQRRVP